MSEVKRRKLTPDDDGDRGAKEKKTFRQLLLDKYAVRRQFQIQLAFQRSASFGFHTALEKFLNAPTVDDPDFSNQVFEAMGETDEVFRWTITLNDSEDFDDDDDDDDGEERQQTFPHLTRFLENPPKNLKFLRLEIKNWNAFKYFPKHISNKDNILEQAEILWDDHDEYFGQSNPEDKLEVILFRCCYVRKLRLENIQALDDSDTRRKDHLWPFESHLEELILKSCRMVVNSPVILHDKTSLPKLRSLEYFHNYEFQEGFDDPVEFWNQWFTRAWQTLERITFVENERIRANNNLFQAMCIAATDSKHSLERLEKLSISLKSGESLLNFEFLRRSRVRQTLKSLSITSGPRMNTSFARILSSFDSIDHLTLNMSGTAEISDWTYLEKMTTFLETYLTQHTALKTLVISGFKPDPAAINAIPYRCLERLEVSELGFHLENHPNINPDEISLTTPPPLLHIVAVENGNVDCDDLATFLRARKCLRSITIRSLGFTKTGLRTLLEACLGSSNLFGFKVSLFDMDKSEADDSDDDEIGVRLFSEEQDCWQKQNRTHDFVTPFMQQIRTHCFLNRYNHSIKQSQKPILAGFLPHVVQQCSTTVGPSGLFVFLKKKLLEDLGLQ